MTIEDYNAKKLAKQYAQDAAWRRDRRERIATAVLAGMWANPEYSRAVISIVEKDDMAHNTAEIYADAAIQQADILIEKLEDSNEI